MNNLWECLPPLRADSFGFREAVIQAGGYGLIDDSSAYHGGSESGGRRAARGVPFSVSELRSKDAVSGSSALLIKEAKEIVKTYHPAFLLLGSGPAASMVGTDLEDTARQIEEACGVKTLAVDINGHRTCDYGLSKTLVAAARASAKASAPRERTIGLIGGCRLDIGKENLEKIQRWCRDQGYEPINLNDGFSRAAETSLNLVLTRSGLEAAVWLEAQFGTPYIPGLPFGRSWSELLKRALETGVLPEVPERDGKKALIIAEQFTGNALRNTLRLEYGYGRVDVCSFLEMEKSLMQQGDRKLRYEDDLKAIFREVDYQTVIADPLYKACGDGRRTWVPLPCKAFLVPTAPFPSLVGLETNQWLDRELKR